MSNDEMLKKWTPIDNNALSELSKTTTSPGIYELSITAVPTHLQKIPGTVSSFVSTYSNPINIGNNTVLGSELVVVRTDQGKLKAYNFAIASSGDGQLYSNGPYKNFPTHHMTSTSQVSLESLFGHIPHDAKSTS